MNLDKNMRVMNNLTVENLFVHNGLLYITDFYRSKQSPFDDFRHKAPEVFEDNEFGEAQEIWSLGVTIYFMATGNFPFESGNDIYNLNYLSRRHNLNHLQKPPTRYPKPNPINRFQNIAVPIFCCFSYFLI